MNADETFDNAPTDGRNDEFPVTKEISGLIESADAFQRLTSRPHCVFFDSSMRGGDLGRYSFVACDPYDWIELASHEGLSRLEEELTGLESSPRNDLPPFQGGAAGLVAYEFGHAFEKLPRVAHDEFAVPDLAMGLYDVVLAFDHHENRSWVISQGFPETDSQARRHRAESRMTQMLEWLEAPVSSNHEASRTGQCEVASPQCETGIRSGLFSNFDKSTYCQMVQGGIDLIRAGDIFQVNLSQRLLYRANTSAVGGYSRLRDSAPATFGGYLDGGEWQIMSASPERFVSCRDRSVEARPIKGTRRQTQQPVADLYAAGDLVLSEKDQAENVMIVDLLRNDLSRVCEDDTIQVPQLCGLEPYGYVQHLVSVVRGKLRAGKNGLDLFRAAFPGGSITGAPKVRAMEIITELERVARGPYCGSLCYVGWDGTLDSSILIRTMTASKGWWQIPVGGGVVAQSTPVGEYEETWDKAAGMLAALE